MVLKIINAICDKLIEAYPTTPIYINSVPEGFIRPSFFIKYVNGVDTDLNKFVLSTNLALQLVAFGQRDAYGNIQTEGQLEVLKTIQDLLHKGYLLVEDRAFKFLDKSTSFQEGDLYVSLNMEVTSDKDFTDEETDTLIGTVELTTEL